MENKQETNCLVGAKRPAEVLLEKDGKVFHARGQQGIEAVFGEWTERKLPSAQPEEFNSTIE